MTRWQRVPVNPIGKPRMTRTTGRMMAQKNPPRDPKMLSKWRSLKRYKAFCDELKLRRVSIPESNAHVVFVLPMPPSWSQVKKDAHRGRPHRQKPDKDNLEKALLDALLIEDCGVWDSRITKVWGDHGAILIGRCGDEIDLEILEGYI